MEDSPAESNPNTPSATVPQMPSAPAKKIVPPSLGSARDLEKTQRRYDKALKELEKALKDVGGVWENFKTTQFSGNISQTDTVLQLQNRINETLNAQTIAKTNPEGWKKVKQVMKTVFIATSPFAKLLLTISKQGSLVCFPR